MSSRRTRLGAGFAVLLASAGLTTAALTGGEDAQAEKPRAVVAIATPQAAPKAADAPRATKGVRERSRSAYRAQSAADATRTVRKHFAEQLESPVERVLDARGGVKDEVAPGVSAPRRGTGVVVTAGTAPTARKLRRSDDAYVAAKGTASARIDATKAQASFGDGGRVALGGERRDGRLLDGNAVHYANVDRDLDSIVQAKGQGVEVFAVARSAAAPEEQELRLDVPKGGSLKLDGKGGARVLDAGGKPTFTVSKPVAIDADGQSVPSSLKLADDETLTLSFPHKDADVRYPVLVDPLIQPWTDGSGVSGSWYQGNPDGLERWTATQTDPNGNAWAPRVGCYQPVSCYGQHGLYLYASQGTNYGAGANAMWKYSLDPSRTTYFKKVTFLNTFFSKRGDTSNTPFLAAGIYGTSGWTGLEQRFSDITNQTIPVTASGAELTASKTAIFGLFNGVSRPLPTWQDAYAGGVIFELDDPEAPTLAADVAGSGGTTQNGWVRGNVEVKPTATDAGLGVWQFALGYPRKSGATGSISHPNGCTGQASAPCPTSSTKSITVDTTTIPDGPQQIGLWAYDAGQKQSSGRGWQLKVDNDVPVVNPIGSLVGKRGQDLMGETGPAGIHVFGMDGTTDAPRSGIQSVSITIDDRAPIAREQTCPASEANCRLDVHGGWLDPATAPSGKHHVKYSVTDRAGNTKTDEWDVFIYRTSWQLGGDNHKIDTRTDLHALNAAIAAADGNAAQTKELQDGITPADWERIRAMRDSTPPEITETSRPAYWVNDPGKLLSFNATEYGPNQSGLKSLRISAPTHPTWNKALSVGEDVIPKCGDDAPDHRECIQHAPIGTTIGDLPSGLHTIEVEAIDAGGNVARKQYHVPYDRTGPTLTTSGGWDDQGPSGPRDTTLRVDADDAHSGVMSIQWSEQHPDGSRAQLPGDNRTDAQCPAFGCEPRSFSLERYANPVDLGWKTGLHTLVVDVYDRAGNVSSKAWNLQYYETSWKYGGANHAVDNDAESDAVIGALRAPSGDSEALQIWRGVATPAERSRISARMANLLLDGSAVRDLQSGALYLYFDGQLHWVTSQGVAEELSLNVMTAVRVTPDVIGLLPRGDDITAANVEPLSMGFEDPLNAHAAENGWITKYSSYFSERWEGDLQVFLNGKIDWQFKGTNRRGIFRTASYVAALSGPLCLQVRVTSHTGKFSAGLPPSISLDTEQVTDGWVPRCRAEGASTPGAIHLAGVMGKGSGLYKITIDVARSTSKDGFKKNMRSKDLWFVF